MTKGIVADMDLRLQSNADVEVTCPVLNICEVFSIQTRPYYSVVKRRDRVTQ